MISSSSCFFHLLSCVLCAVIIFGGKWLRMVLCSCGWEHNSPLVYDTIYAELDCAELHRARERTQNFHALHTPYTDTMRMLMHTTTRTRSPAHQANIRCTRKWIHTCTCIMLTYRCKRKRVWYSSKSGSWMEKREQTNEREARKTYIHNQSMPRVDFLIFPVKGYLSDWNVYFIHKEIIIFRVQFVYKFAFLFFIFNE